MKKKRKSIMIPVIIVIMVVFFAITLIKDRDMGETVIVAADNIPEGTIIDEDNYSMFFEEKSVQGSIIAEGTITDKKDITGKKIIINVEKNTVMQKGFVVEEIYKINEMKEPVTLGLKVNDISQMACGIIRTKDYIDISVVDEQTGECIDILRNVYVSGCYNSDGTPITDEEGCAAYINVTVEKEDELLINEKLSEGELRICKVGD